MARHMLDTPGYAEARAAHIAKAAATDGWGKVRRPGGKLIGRLMRVHVNPEVEPPRDARFITDFVLAAVFAPFVMRWAVVPITPALEAQIAAREKRQNREKLAA